MPRLRPLLPVLLAAVLVATAAQPCAAAMRKQPYLLYPGVASQMRVLWQLDATAVSTIEWGPDSAYATGRATSAEYGADHQHAFTIGGLAPATRYLYRVTTDGVAYGGSFVSAPPPDAHGVEFLAYGDTRTYPATHDQVAAAIRAACAADPALQTFALFMGDYVGSGGSETSWTDEFFGPAYPNIRAFMADVPLQPCMGNHENTSPLLFAKYEPCPWVAGRYWSFDYGPVHVTVVDQYTSYGPFSAQLQWIADDLAATSRPWKVVVLHEPGWSSGSGHANNASVQAYLQPLFEQYGVAIVFAGHNHNYCRAVAGGVVHVTTGGGGAPIEPPLDGQPNVVASAAANHYCTVAVDGGTLTLRAIAVPGGAVLDSFTLVRGAVGVNADPRPAPRLALSVPAPNPGRGSTTLRCSLPRAGSVRIEILDLGGRRRWHAETMMAAGEHEWRWDGRDETGGAMSPGLYFVRLATPWGERTSRMAWFD